MFSPKLHINHSSPDFFLVHYPYELPRPHKCPRQDSCIGGLNSSCGVGYEGPLCEVCSVGHYKWLKSCEKCPTKKWMAAQFSIIAVVILTIVFVVVWTSRKNDKKSKGRSSVDIILGRLKIVVGFYQVTFGVLEAFSYIKWPDSLASIGKFSEMLQLSVLQIAPVQCIFPELKRDTYNAFASLYAMLAVNAAAMLWS